MSDEYTPTTEEIRDYVGEGGEPRPWIAPGDDEANETARLAAFDRWLAAHDSDVAARAWDVGMQAAIDAAEDTTDSFGNLYRIDWLNRMQHEREQNPYGEVDTA